MKKKDFGISKTLTRSVASLKEEVDKCILLCYERNSNSYIFNDRKEIQLL